MKIKKGTQAEWNIVENGLCAVINTRALLSSIDHLVMSLRAIGVREVYEDMYKICVDDIQSLVVLAQCEIQDAEKWLQEAIEKAV